MECSIIIPVYNEAESLKILHTELQTAVAPLFREYEVLYVDDGSTDGSAWILENLRRQDTHVRVISFLRNRGQSAALWEGFRAARGRWIVTLDADLQNPPQEISKLAAFTDRFECVVGIRQMRKDSFMKRFASRVARVCRRIVLGDITKDTGCSLRICQKEAACAIPPFRNFHRYFPFLVRRMGFSLKEIPLAHRPRRYGVSKYGTIKRAVEGSIDLWGVWWLSRRLLKKSRG
ncbi:MAG: glycosyltransferase [Candidatus Omnitrophica bacterium]|nr:glycosyltransferase [Candidatus Omnitrophota bacterium]